MSSKNAVELATQAAANAACIAREIIGINPDYLSLIGNFDNVTAAAVLLAEREVAAPHTGSGNPFWEGRSWEEVCFRIAGFIVLDRAPFTEMALAEALRPKRSGKGSR
jgi:hypothetical protein